MDDFIFYNIIIAATFALGGKFFRPFRGIFPGPEVER